MKIKAYINNLERMGVIMKREVTRTISAELKPYGNTDVSALKDVIDRDVIRNNYRREIVRLIDERHKALLSKAQDAPLDFTTLEALIRRFNKDKKNSQERSRG